MRKPAICKQARGRPVYQSQGDFGRIRKATGPLKIGDFGSAVFGDVNPPHNHDIQPQQFSAPEVLLRAGWSYSADIWNLGMAVRGQSRSLDLNQ